MTYINVQVFNWKQKVGQILLATILSFASTLQPSNLGYCENNLSIGLWAKVGTWVFHSSKSVLVHIISSLGKVYNFVSELTGSVP